jgi:histidinol phosphatase-like PHP family hydrolase
MENNSYIGSKWWKFDFHTHTPASNDYGHGDESYKDITPLQWLQNAMYKQLDCVVVTDHNSGEWIDRIKEENESLRLKEPKPDWYHDIIIFPGIEITVADSRTRLHLLAVFDPSCNGDVISSVLGSCGITSNFGDDTQTSSSTSFIKTIQKINEAKGIAIAAHINGKKGLLENDPPITPELNNSLKALTAAEFCGSMCCQTNSDLNKLLEHISKVAGSDAHKPDEIGIRYSWIKMSKPTIEGLRLALSDCEFCVVNQKSNPNHNPSCYISNLNIISMYHCGRIPDSPFHIPLHPHFNAIIGGRGAGKSTLLESIRIASDNFNNLDEKSVIKNNLENFMKSHDENGVMLKETKINLWIHRYGKKYQLSWSNEDHRISLMEENNVGQFVSIETTHIDERFPISIFSQKQINELAKNPCGLLDIIDRSPEVNKQEWALQWESIKSEFIRLRERRRELLRQLEGGKPIRIKLKDIENDLKQYEEKGHGVNYHLIQNTYDVVTC